MWLKTGQLKIIDRKKSIFKLSNGEYVAPERIENILIQSPYVAQAFVYGNSLRSSLVAVVVPDFENLSDELQNRDALKSPEDICRSEDVNSLILKTLREVSEKSGLRKFEWVKTIHLSPVMFSVDNDILTPSFKLERNVAVKAFFRSMSCTLPESDSFEVPHSAIPGVSGSVYRHPGYKNRLQRFIDDDSSIVTSFDVFKRTVERYPDRPCHGTRPLLDDGS
ncbi:hypothetical protein FOZ61_001762, partial [Perkinsus olseni]